MRLALRLLISSLVMLPALAFPCSLALSPNGAEPVNGPIAAQLDGGADDVAPSQVTVTNVAVTLVKNPCSGAGMNCPNLDSLKMTVAVTDDKTPAERLRYVAYFGATEAEVNGAAAPEILFKADSQSPTTVSASLGLSRARDGSGFARKALCFSIAAVDDGANIGPKSTVKCLDTTDESTATVVNGNCGVGCSSVSGEGIWAATALLLTWGARRRRQNCI